MKKKFGKLSIIKKKNRDKQQNYVEKGEKSYMNHIDIVRETTISYINNRY